MFMAPQKIWLNSTTTFNGESPWGKSNESSLKALHLSRHDCGKTKAEKTIAASTLGRMKSVMDTQKTTIDNK